MFIGHLTFEILKIDQSIQISELDYQKKPLDLYVVKQNV